MSSLFRFRKPFQFFGMRSWSRGINPSLPGHGLAFLLPRIETALAYRFDFRQFLLAILVPTFFTAGIRYPVSRCESYEGMRDVLRGE